MGDVEDDQLQTGESGSSKTFPKQCSALRKGEHVCIKTRPCKIVEMSTSKTGKHGHAKVHMVALDIFTGKKLEDICPSTHNMECPIVNRKEYQLLGINDEDDHVYVSLMDLDTCETRDDVKLPTDEIGGKIREAYEKDESGVLVTVVSAMGEEMILGFKNMPKSD